MINSRLPFRTARKTSRDGFTLVELLVVIGIIAILAGVALGPITSGIEKAKESSGMQSARSINLLLFTYSNDNNQIYPPGTGTSNPPTTAVTGSGKSESVAIQLLNGGYTSDPTIFALTAPGVTRYSNGSGAAAGYTDFAGANISWDFMTGATTTTGITSSASDLLPTVWNHDGFTITSPVAGTATTPTLTGGGAFAKNGIAVGYKSNSAVFLKATNVAGTLELSNPPFISASYSDSNTYTSIVP